MRKLFVILGLLIACNSFASSEEDIAASDQNDAMYAKLYGSCTRQACPPGSTVVMTAKDGDSGIATTADGQNYDLIGLRKIHFIVIANDDHSLSSVTVKAPGGTIYSIQRMFLKRK